MRAKGRKRGRFVALDGLKKVPGPPGSRFPLMIVDGTGLPVFYLSEWYRRRKEFDPGRTPDTYLDLLLPWASFLLQKGYVWNATPERVRTYLVELLRQIKNAGAPDHAGIRSESHQETHHAYPTAFFRQKRGMVWEPDVVMEPDAVQERMRKALDFMIQHATFQRDKVILLLLRQTGARLSEIIEMTVGGYRKACHPERALVKNKGSRGREEKLIYFTPIIEQQLLSYIRKERATHDLQGRKRLEQLDETDPLFLTEDGRPYTRSAFYYHWYKLFEPAQAQCRKQERVEFSPH